MKDNDNIVGLSMLIGMKMGSVRARAAEQSEALDRMRAELRAKVTTALYAEAFALAAADVMAAILAELKSGQRHLSDPAAVTERNKLYVTKAATHLRQMSKGTVRLARADIERIAAERPLK